MIKHWGFAPNPNRGRCPLYLCWGQSSPDPIFLALLLGGKGALGDLEKIFKNLLDRFFAK